MYIWHETKGRSDWDDVMTQYRNALVKEINFVLSPRYASVNTTQAVAKDFEQQKNLRIHYAEHIKDPVRRRQVELSLIEEPLNFTHDTSSADIFIKYFELPKEQYGSGLYYTMRQPKSAYQRVVEKREFEKAVEYLEFFPDDDAKKEFIYLFSVASENELTRTILFFLGLFRDKRYKDLTKEADIQNILKTEYNRAEQDKRIEDANAIASYIDDKEVHFRIKAMEALLGRDSLTAVEYLQKIENKNSLHNAVIDAYWHEYHAASKDPDRYRHAFALALNGGLDGGEFREYVEHPATKIIEQLCSEADISDAQIDKAEEYIPFVPKEEFRNICADLFIRMIKDDKTTKAKHLKKRLDVKFDQGKYESEVMVMDFFAQLTATKADSGVAKGHENLETALDVAEIFDLTREEINRIRLLLFKQFIKEKKYANLKDYYIPDDEEMIEIIDDECQKFLDEKHTKDAFALVSKLNVKFPAEIKRKRRAFLADMVRSSALSREDFAKGVAVEQLYGLDVIPDYFYRKFIENCFASIHLGTQTLIDLNETLIPHMSSCLRISLYNHIADMRLSNPQLAGELEEAYRAILPPSFWNRIICVILHLLGME